MMETAAAHRARKTGLNLAASFFNARDIARQINVPFGKMFLGVIGSGWKNARQLAFMANGFKAIRLATEEGDAEKGLLPVGQVQGLVHDEPSVAEAIERIVAEAVAVKEKIARMMT